MSLSKTQIQKYFPFIVALIVALAVLIYYIISGQGSLIVSTRNLQSSDPQVDSVQIQDGQNGDKNAQIKCKDGSSYEVYYPPGETNYTAVGSSKCPQD